MCIRDRTPQRGAGGDDVAPARAVGEPRDGNSEHRVEERERQALQIAHLHVGNPEVPFDRTDEKAQNLPIDVRADAGERENGGDIPRIGLSQLAPPPPPPNPSWPNAAMTRSLRAASRWRWGVASATASRIEGAEWGWSARGAHCSR